MIVQLLFIDIIRQVFSLFYVILCISVIVYNANIQIGCEYMKACAILGFSVRKAAECQESNISYSALKKLLFFQLEHLIEQEFVTHFLCGLSVGAEMLASELILELKENHPYVTLESIIPYETQASRWSEPLRDKYFNIAARCDKETLLQKHYSPDCLYKQALYMIDKSDIIISAWSHPTKQMARAISHAHEIGKRVIELVPKPAIK